MTAEQVSPTRTSRIDWRIAKAVRLAIMDTGRQQRDIALASGMHPSSFSKSMQGERPWRAEEVLRIALATGVPVTDLLPHLDSNQEPSGYVSAQVTALWHPSMSDGYCEGCGKRYGGCVCRRGVVVDLGAYRSARAS